ncbi:MAG: hypothetical protein GX354_09590, partial [Firmicutes bacterium]|nr:hypothetical protein [Bacillota bacterium]
QNSLVNEGCVVKGLIQGSVVFPGVSIGEGAEVYDSVLMPNVKIGDHAIIRKAIIGSNTSIGNCSAIGGEVPDLGLTVIGEDLGIAAKSRVQGIFDGEVS